MSTIEWTEVTWNPVTGCSKVSAGCKNCYADRMAKRLRLMGVEKYRNGFEVTIHPKTLEDPLRWKTPKIVFVNSMSDLFHSKVPLKFIKSVFEVMNEASQHTFQVLTKRPERVLRESKKLPWAPNIWMGTSIESEKFLHRAETLRKTDAQTKFLSLEPLLGPLPNLKLKGMDWVIVGGESGPRSRPMEKDWVLEIQAKCLDKDVPFFFKQWGGFNKKKAGRKLNRREWNAMPEVAVAL